MNFKRIIISRTDSIGDVMLTLPMCGVIKKHFPKCEIIFLGRTYTKAVIQCSSHVDHFENWDEWKDSNPQNQIDQLSKWNADVIIHVFPRQEILWVAKRARISWRIATGRRLQTITKCNKLVFFTRKNSELHEAQLNLKLLSPLGIKDSFSTTELANLYGFVAPKSISVLSVFEKAKIRSEELHVKKRIILHPLSQGSAVEWGLKNFQNFIDLLDPNRYDVFITGTKAEGDRIRQKHTWSGNHVHDLCGVFSLDELIVFISACDVLVAASTGPLHIAAALGIKAFGLYSPKRPIHSGRWAPLGVDAHVLTADKHPLKGEYLDVSAERVLSVVAG